MFRWGLLQAAAARTHIQGYVAATERSLPCEIEQGTQHNVHLQVLNYRLYPRSSCRL